MPTYQANEKLLARAPPHAKFKFMNSLRARDVEVTDAIRLEPRSTLCEQAESRLHKRLLGYFTYPRPKTPSAGVAGGYRKLSRSSPEVQQLLENGGERWRAPCRTRG